jgi:hypothetical protein
MTGLQQSQSSGDCGLHHEEQPFSVVAGMAGAWCSQKPGGSPVVQSSERAQRMGVVAGGAVVLLPEPGWRWNTTGLQQLRSRGDYGQHLDEQLFVVDAGL